MVENNCGRSGEHTAEEKGLVEVCDVLAVEHGLATVKKFPVQMKPKTAKAPERRQNCKKRKFVCG